MKDQVDGLRVDGVGGGVSEQHADVRTSATRSSPACAADRCRLLYVSPERLVGEGSQAFRRLLQQCGVRFIAIDEAHCISQWGHDFRPEYRQLGRLRDDFPGVVAPRLHRHGHRARPRATSSPSCGCDDRAGAGRIVRSAESHLSGAAARQPAPPARCRFSARHEGEAGIIYCSSRREVESLAEWLQGEGHQRRAVPRRPARRRRAAGIRRRFSTSAPTSSSRRWRSAWASIDRTSASSSTPARRGRPSTTSRNRDAPAATDCPPSAC